MSAAVRLRPLVEAVHDGTDLWLLRGPAGGDCRIPAPSEEVLALVELLAAGGEPPALVQALRDRGHDVRAELVREALAALDGAELLEPVVASPPDIRVSRQLLYLRDRAPRGAQAGVMQRTLRDARVAVIGCGGLGSWAAAGLACIGVGRLTLVDGDRVERSNLNRQLLFRERDVGRSKVEAAAESLGAFDEQLELRAIDRFVDGAGAVRDCIDGHDAVVACADQPVYEIARWINDACRDAGIPHISAGQLPPIVRVGPMVIPGETACVRCLEAALRESTQLYDRLEAIRRDDHRPQATLGPASGIAGQLMAMEILHLLTGLARPATADAVWSIDLRTLEVERTRVERVRGCPGCPGDGAP